MTFSYDTSSIDKIPYKVDGKEERSTNLVELVEQKFYQLSVAADLLRENNLLDEFRRRVRVNGEI